MKMKQLKQTQLFNNPSPQASTALVGYTPNGKRRFEVQFMSERCDWATPQGLFDKLNKEFDFTPGSLCDLKEC